MFKAARGGGITRGAPQSEAALEVGWPVAQGEARRRAARPTHRREGTSWTPIAL